MIEKLQLNIVPIFLIVVLFGQPVEHIRSLREENVLKNQRCVEQSSEKRGSKQECAATEISGMPYWPWPADARLAGAGPAASGGA